MQRLLTEEEYENLAPISEVAERTEALEAARKLIIKIANIPCGKTYCDACPISDIGHYELDDPNAISREHSRLICSNFRRYSK